MKTRFTDNRGLTLIELLIVMLISGIVLTAVMKIFTQSQVIYNVQEEVAMTQQNVRAAKMFLERDIRMAGSGVTNLYGPNDDAGDLPLPALQFGNNVGPNGTDQLTIIYNNPDGNPCGEIVNPATVLCSDLPLLTLSNKLAKNDKPNNGAVADVVEDSATLALWENKNCSCNGTVYGPGKPIPLIVTSPDKSKSSLLVATSFLNSQKVQNHKVNKAADIPDYEKFYEYIGEDTAKAIENKVLNDYEAGSTVSFFSSPKVTYSIGDEDGISVLYRDTGSAREVLAEHIEDFQCAFELEDGSRIATGDPGDKADLDATDIPNIRRVRINILGRSAHPHIQGGAFAGQRMPLEDHDVGPSDNFRRRLLSVTVKVRNFGLNVAEP